jgi:hypothetical protein
MICNIPHYPIRLGQSCKLRGYAVSKVGKAIDGKLKELYYIWTDLFVACGEIGWVGICLFPDGLLCGARGCSNLLNAPFVRIGDFCEII